MFRGFHLDANPAGHVAHPSSECLLCGLGIDDLQAIARCVWLPHTLHPTPPLLNFLNPSASETSTFTVFQSLTWDLSFPSTASPLKLYMLLSKFMTDFLPLELSNTSFSPSPSSARSPFLQLISVFTFHQLASSSSLSRPSHLTCALSLNPWGHQPPTMLSLRVPTLAQSPDLLQLDGTSQLPTLVPLTRAGFQSNAEK